MPTCGNDTQQKKEASELKFQTKRMRVCYRQWMQILVEKSERMLLNISEKYEIFHGSFSVFHGLVSRLHDSFLRFTNNGFTFDRPSPNSLFLFFCCLIKSL